ncbi:MAG: hypothetical protein ABR559_05310 [Gemmatimonadota bacterium]
MRPTVLVCALAGVAATLPSEEPCCALTYRVHPDPVAGAVDVALTLQGFQGDTLALVRQSARPLTGLLADEPRVEGAGRAQWSLVDGAPRWAYPRPATGWPERLVIHYQLLITAERPLNAWSVGLDRDLLYAPAEALFLVPALAGDAADRARVRVRWDLPEGWQASTGWADNDLRGTRALIKTNILAGEIARQRLAACGLTIELGIHGDWGDAPAALAAQLRQLACAARHRLGEPQVDRFAVTLVEARFPMTSGNRNGPHAIGFVHALPGGGAPATRLLAHEVVHLWQRFDAPMWFQEGVNDYVALQLANEAGLLDDAALAAQLATIDSVYREHPERDRHSFADEAEAVPPYGPSDAYLAYRKGALVGLALDRELRLWTDGYADVAALWRAMNAGTRWGHIRWTDAEIAEQAAELTGGNLEPFFGRYVGGTDELPATDQLLASLTPLPAKAPPAPGLGALAAFLQNARARLIR